MYTSIMHGYQHLRVSEDIDSLDLAKYVMGGQLRLVLTIDSGIFIGGAKAGMPLEDVNSRNAIFSSVPINRPSMCHIMNRGSIWGVNGNGGAIHYTSDWVYIHGGDGGAAIKLNSAISINTLSGTVKCGGGGGGAGYFAAITKTTANGGGHQVNTPPPAPQTIVRDPETNKYGESLGGISYQYTDQVSYGGRCVGFDSPGELGSPDEFATIGPGNPGPAIDASGNTVTVINGAASIIGAIV